MNEARRLLKAVQALDDMAEVDWETVREAAYDGVDAFLKEVDE